MLYGFTGSILQVDLSSAKYWIEHKDEKFYRKYWGGRSIGLYYLLTELEPGIDPLSSHNILIFTAGFATGSQIPGFSRYTVCAKSPLTGAEGESEAGGFWGPELKKSGFDAIVVRGRSDKPVYIWIDNGKVEIRNACHLWGKETGETEKIIKEELSNSKIRILQIGIGGENLVHFANIVNELKHFNGRNGLGAVMGSKKLKAIAVKGDKKIDLFDVERVKKITKKFNIEAKNQPTVREFRELGTVRGLRGMHEMGCLPSYNWKMGMFKNGENLTAENYVKTILKKNEGCYSCPIRCKRVVEIKDKDIQVDCKYGGPEYESVVSLGSICGIDDLKIVAKANELCNKFTLDTISTGMTIAFAMQCYEESLLDDSDTEGIKLSFGNKEALIIMIKKIANREGLGNILADGSFLAAKKIGKTAFKYVHSVKKQEIPMHDPRIKTGVALQYALADYGADHMKAMHDSAFNDESSWGCVFFKGFGIQPVKSNDIGPEKVALFKILDLFGSLMDILGICKFFFSPSTCIGTLEDIIEIIYGVTGWKTTWYELIKVSERSINMARIFNLREGFTIQDDVLPKVFFNNFKGGPLDGQGAINKEDFEKAVKLRNELMGWDPDTGIPSRAKLIELNSSWLIDIIESLK